MNFQIHLNWSLWNHTVNRTVSDDINLTHNFDQTFVTLYSNVARETCSIDYSILHAIVQYISPLMYRKTSWTSQRWKVKSEAGGWIVGSLTDRLRTVIHSKSLTIKHWLRQGSNSQHSVYCRRYSSELFAQFHAYSRWKPCLSRVRLSRHVCATSNDEETQVRGSTWFTRSAQYGKNRVRLALCCGVIIFHIAFCLCSLLELIEYFFRECCLLFKSA